MNHDIPRRKFMQAAAGFPALALGAAAFEQRKPPPTGPALARVDSLPANVTRTWLGPQYWSNRLADWRLANGRIESLTATGGGQTVAVLTRRIAPGNTGGSISVRTGTLAGGVGFSGFLIGAGAGALDWRAAALVMAASGQGGGLLATYESDGNVRFRDHTSETDQFAYGELPVDRRSGPAPPRTGAEDVVLQLDFDPTSSGIFDLTLTARKFADGTLLSRTIMSDVADADLVGGISLISTAYSGGTSARYWFRNLRTSGAKIAVELHETGPIFATMYSLNGTVLKLSAQFMPIGATDPQRATLQKRAPGASTWTTVQSVTIGAGYMALFRVNGWRSMQPWEFRVTWASGTAQAASYTGRIRHDPKGAPQLTMAVVNCTIHSYRHLNSATSGSPKLPGENFLGLYTNANLYFPYSKLVANITRQNPDILIALGDQYYENMVTAAHRSGELLDVLSRWYLWLWSFRQITRSTPTICLVDDHDVYHPNLWGWSGSPAPRGSYGYGGYIMPPAWVNAVQRIQCGHNPDPYDPRPVRQGINVHYTAFSYGGVSFALLEDRKFKNTNEFGIDRAGNPLVPPRELLGSRQESLLAAWARMFPGQPKVCLTQSPYACVQTTPDGLPVADPDSNGGPVVARRRALKLLRTAKALMLSGDQHCGTLVRHGIDTYTDGPINFTPPAAGSAYQRWFSPASPLPNSRGEDTGDWTDGFGNRFRVLAVANPKISYADVYSAQRGNLVGDRSLKREGYGIVHVDKAAKVFRLECWPWATDPTTPDATQFAGWPYTVSFATVGNAPQPGL